MVKSLFALVPTVAANDITLATFDGAEGTTLTWTQKNDPVMGGQSTGTFTVQDNVGVFDGTCKIVPFLGAPGFIKAETTKTTLPDVSSCSGLALTVKSTTDYDGFRFSFGTKRSDCGKFFATGHKANFQAPKGEFGTVQIPFTDFTDCWDDGTGDAIKTCADDSKYCPDQNTLSNMQTMSVWAEGKEGDVHLEIQSVVATGCADSLVAAASVPLLTFDGSETDHGFKALVDPVMGGQSVATATVDTDGQFGVLDGEVKIVPSLNAPGFITGYAQAKFPDASSAIDGDLVLTVRSTTNDYTGYKVSFAAGTISPQFSCASGGAVIGGRGCFKAGFTVPAGDDFVDVRIPFKSFTDKWSSATGEPTTTCAEDSSVCPTASKLSKIQRIEVWGEGAAGKVHIEVKGVRAEATSVMLPHANLGADRPNIVELAESVADLSTLVSAVVAADLADTLSSPGPFTVFAPTNEGFAALPQGTLDTLMKPENKAQLVDILTYHVLPEQVLSTDLKFFQRVATVEGKNLHVLKTGAGVHVGPDLQNLRKVVGADNLASNGVAHIIDGVMLPPAEHFDIMV